jgi:hypothetical protein
LIPKTVRDAGFSVPEIAVEAKGTLEQQDHRLLLAVPGLSRSFLLAGGKQREALAKHLDLVGKEIRVTGNLRLTEQTPPYELTVEDFQTGAK